MQIFSIAIAIALAFVVIATVDTVANDAANALTRANASQIAELRQ